MCRLINWSGLKFINKLLLPLNFDENFHEVFINPKGIEAKLLRIIVYRQICYQLKFREQKVFDKRIDDVTCSLELWIILFSSL